jgi:hypothetical protein
MAIAVFRQGSENDQLWYSYFDGTSWAADVQVPNVLLPSAPSAVALPGGGISVFHIGTGIPNALWYAYFNNGEWASDVNVPNVVATSSAFGDRIAWT